MISNWKFDKKNSIFHFISMNGLLWLATMVVYSLNKITNENVIKLLGLKIWYNINFSEELQICSMYFGSLKNNISSIEILNLVKDYPFLKLDKLVHVENLFKKENFSQYISILDKFKENQIHRLKNALGANPPININTNYNF